MLTAWMCEDKVTQRSDCQT